MLVNKRFLLWMLCFQCFLSLGAQEVNNVSISIVLPSKPSARMVFASDYLARSLHKAGYKVAKTSRVPSSKSVQQVIALSVFKNQGINAAQDSGKEGYAIAISKGKTAEITGGDENGLLYGCIELAETIDRLGRFPDSLSVADKPEMVLRGTCIGIQKPYYLPGRTVYEYPFTPETFSWFYDKSLWLRTLDSLVVNRYNSLYLWNGHPFASLVKLKDYPYAVEVDEATFKKNEEIYKFITEEADKRGIWVIQMFYNIIVSRPFAEKHGIKTQDRERPIVPLIADYTRKSIAAFVEKYPNVGLLVTLGEAMEGVGQDDVNWFTKTIIPGVKDGLKALGKTEQPPIVLRAHDSDAPMVMDSAMKIYSNLYTMAKYNGEALTTYTPRGSWAELHRKLSAIGTVQIENVHILANLEPFRYASPYFIRKCVQAMHTVYHANGLHLYPQHSYWDWPWAADSAATRLYEIDRDWLWYRQWARYAWKSTYTDKEENTYWSEVLGSAHKSSAEFGKMLLTAYEHAGEISPKILRRFGITDGNRQTSTLGMTMPQLVNPFRFGLFTLLYTSESPEGEMLIEYAEKEAKGEAHIGETPLQIIYELKMHGDAAVLAIEKAGTLIAKENDEWLKIKNDMYIHRAMAYHYAEKATAALHALRYKYSGNIADLELAQPHLKKSVEWYEELTRLTDNTYRYANSMQTQQRKIPFRGVNATFIHWREVLPEFKKELQVFEIKIDSIRMAGENGKAVEKQKLQPVEVVLSGSLNQFFSLKAGTVPILTQNSKIVQVDPVLTGLKGVVVNHEEQVTNGTTLEFSTQKAVHVLVGYFNDTSKKYLPPPQLETNAAANEFGQGEIKLANAVLLDGLPPVNLHSYTFGPGKHTLKLAKGICLIAGFTDGNKPVPIFDAGLSLNAKPKEVDWLFE